MGIDKSIYLANLLEIDLCMGCASVEFLKHVKYKTYQKLNLKQLIFIRWNWRKIY